MVFPSREEYQKVAARYGIVPVWEEVSVDLETPISIFKKAAEGEFAYLLESVEGGEQVARYSLIGFDPFIIYKAKGDHLDVTAHGCRSHLTGDPLEHLKELMASLRAAPLPGKQRFWGGAVGYFGYDLFRHFETIPEVARDDLDLPDCFFVLTKVVLIYDHVTHRLQIVALVPVESNPKGAYDQSLAAIQGVIEQLRSSLPSEDAVSSQPFTTLVPNMTREEYLEKVRRAKEYISAGDVQQVVLSQRFRCPTTSDPFSIYRMLRSLNPSPYMYYLKFGGTYLIGSSPEMLVRVENGSVETHPIAGTRRRGANSSADELLARELHGDPKERAEHEMLVELGKADFEKVCASGSVRVTKFLDVEYYSHVMHLVSHVRGMLAPGEDIFDAFRACFPAGTVSGAPRKRALQIIEELEPTRRGPYAGAVGYFSFHGNLDSCITIRTILFKDGVAYVQAGAGIVAGSEPEREYEECVNKAQALLRSLELADSKEGAFYDGE